MAIVMEGNIRLTNRGEAMRSKDIHVIFKFVQMSALIGDLILQGVEPIHPTVISPMSLLTDSEVTSTPVTYFSSSFSRMYKASWAASRLVNASL
jgi:hypothetical protein